MLEKEKLFLNNCIKKYSYKHFDNETLSDGIISKYTLARMFHGYTCKDKTYHQLLERLGYYYNNNADILSLEILSQTLLQHIELNNQNEIADTIIKMETLTNKYPTHIYFKEANEYINLMKIHYIYHSSLTFIAGDFPTLFYFPKVFRYCIIHSVCENLLFNAHFPKLEEIHDLYILNEENYVLLDYWRMLVLQAHKKSVEAYNIYRNYQYRFSEDNNIYQYIRFTLLFTQGHIRKHPEKTKEHLDKLSIIINKYNIHSHYNAYIDYTYGLLLVREGKYKEAYDYFYKGYTIHTYTKVLFIPYLVLVSILINKHVPDHLFKDNTLLSKQTQKLYDLYNKKDLKALLAHIVNKYPKPACLNPCFEALIPILRTIVIDLVEETRCYKYAIQFDQEVKLYNQNLYL